MISFRLHICHRRIPCFRVSDWY